MCTYTRRSPWDYASVRACAHTCACQKVFAYCASVFSHCASVRACEGEGARTFRVTRVSPPLEMAPSPYRGPGPTSENKVCTFDSGLSLSVTGWDRLQRRLTRRTHAGPGHTPDARVACGPGGVPELGEGVLDDRRRRCRAGLGLPGYLGPKGRVSAPPRSPTRMWGARAPPTRDAQEPTPETSSQNFLCQ